MPAVIVGFCFLSGVVTSCSFFSKKPPQSSLLSHARIGMNFLDVMKEVGIPDTIIHIGVVQDQYGSQTKTDEWWYGNNAVIVMVNDTVNAIDSNALATQEKILRIIDSAKAVEGNNGTLIHQDQQ